METQPIPSVCPTCHTQVRATDFFCFNCGTNLKPKPLSTSITTQLGYYIATLLLPPLGIIWGFRYLRQDNTQAKIIGLVMIVATFIELTIIMIGTVNTINFLNNEVNRQLRMMNF